MNDVIIHLASLCIVIKAARRNGMSQSPPHEYIYWKMIDAEDVEDTLEEIIEFLEHQKSEY